MMFLSLLACTATTDNKSEELVWVAVGEGLDAALLSIWGTSADDVWVVGADAGSGGTFVHYDGKEWSAPADLGAGDAWWVTGTDSSIWVGGADGRLFRYGRSDGALDTFTPDPSVVFYGLWAASDQDVWAVGGNTSLTAEGAVLYHFDGTSWTAQALPTEAAAQVSLFKVSGAAANDIWAVGNAGVAIHFDGNSWTSQPTNVTANLFGFSGRYAVGGNFTGAIVSWNGSSFAEESPPYAYQFEGVIDDGIHAPTAVGYQGGIYLRGEAGWDKDPAEAATLEDLHAVWIDPDGGTWAVGGHLSSDPLIHGVIVYKGSREIGTLESL